MTGAFPSPKEAADWIVEVLSKGSLMYTVSLLQDDRPISERDPIGIIGLSKWGTLHYIFDPNFWGKGYCTEALLSYLPELWKWQPERKQVSGAVYQGNMGSRRVLEKCGFWIMSGGGRVVVSAKSESKSERREQTGEEIGRYREDRVKEITQETVDALKKAVEGLALTSKSAMEPVRPGETNSNTSRGNLIRYTLDRPEEYSAAVVDKVKSD
jgi:hypothetical protein